MLSCSSFTVCQCWSSNRLPKETRSWPLREEPIPEGQVKIKKIIDLFFFPHEDYYIFRNTVHFQVMIYRGTTILKHSGVISGLYSFIRFIQGQTFLRKSKGSLEKWPGQREVFFFYLGFTQGAGQSGHSLEGTLLCAGGEQTRA